MTRMFSFVTITLLSLISPVTCDPIFTSQIPPGEHIDWSRMDQRIRNVKNEKEAVLERLDELNFEEERLAHLEEGDRTYCWRPFNSNFPVVREGKLLAENRYLENDRTILESKQKSLETEKQALERKISTICICVAGGILLLAISWFVYLKFFRKQPKSETSGSILDLSKPILRHLEPINHSDFKFLRKVGQGAYGVVRAALNNRTGGIFAVKQLWIGGETEPNFERMIEKAESEVRILSSLDHPHIVKYLGSQMADQHFNIFLEFVVGGSLQDIIAKSTVSSDLLSMPVVRLYANQILDGLAFLHEQNVIHRDLKPANVLVTTDGKLKLTDFGASFDLSRVTHTTKQTFTGTPTYMAPEVVLRSNYTTKCDIWSFGVLVFYMVVGSSPFGDTEAYTHLLNLAGGSVLLEWPENAPQAFTSFVRACTRWSPEERPDCGGLAEHGFLTGMEVSIDSRSVSIDSRLVTPNHSPTLQNICPKKQGEPSPIERCIIIWNKPSAQPAPC